MTECESIRGKWSTPGQPPNRCPACKGPMPYAGRSKTWRDYKAQPNRGPRGSEPFTIKRTAAQMTFGRLPLRRRTAA